MRWSVLTKVANRPSVAIVSVLLGLAIGLSRSPHVVLLKPFGEFYLALLQICILPFLLATIPLALKAAFANTTGIGSVARLAICVVVSLTVVTLTTIAVSSVALRLYPITDNVRDQLGGLVGSTASSVDVEFALRPVEMKAAPEISVGLTSILPTNVFSALSMNDSLKVVVFSIIFGIGLVAADSQAGESAFGVLRHVQRTCILLFEWFNVAMPLGVISLIAPQIAQLGPQTYAVLAPLALAFLASAGIVIVVSIAVIASSLKVSPVKVLSRLLPPLSLAAATRNAIVCAPSALTAMTDDLRASRSACNLFIPIGFAALRSGNIVHFMAATMFIGYLLERPFSPTDFAMMAALALMASFATIGIAGVAGLAPVAAVMGPFGLSFELALPLLIVLDPVASMVRGMINVAVGCQIAAAAGGREAQYER